MKKKHTLKRFVILFIVIVLLGNAITNPKFGSQKFNCLTKMEKHNQTTDIVSLEKEDGICYENCTDADKTGCVRRVHINGVTYYHFNQYKGDIANHIFLWNEVPDVQPHE